jgi:hypothetical protein
MPCVRQKLNGYAGDDLQGRVPRGRIYGEHNLRDGVNFTA